MLVYTQYRNDFHNDSKRRKKPTQCTCYKNTTKLHVSVAAAIICSILGLRISRYMPNQRINTAQKETHSKILPGPTYIEITKNSIDLSRSTVTAKGTGPQDRTGPQGRSRCGRDSTHRRPCGTPPPNPATLCDRSAQGSKS